MEILEVTLLIIAYTTTILALFLSIICYKRNIETPESIGFLISVLLLIVSMTATYFFEILHTTEHANILVLLAMTLVGIATPLDVLAERNHQVSSIIKKLLIGFSGILTVLVLVGHFIGLLPIIQYIVAVFLGGTVVFSMILIKITQPKINIANREKKQRYIANAFLVFTPLSLLANYVADLQEVSTKVGFTLPLIFIFLSTTKFWDDMQRLSLFKSDHKPKSQYLQNYSLTKREQEVAMLLIEGKTYRQISEQLFISIPTVKTHAYNLYKKCKINNRIELINLLNY